MTGGGTWAVLVAEKHADPNALRTSAMVRERDTQQLLARARSVAPTERTCAVIAEEYEEDWQALADSLAPLNSFVLPGDQPMLRGVSRCLSTVRERDPNASVILIPADHCAAVETSWVASAKNALRLGMAQPDTVYILHDKLENDPRSSRKYPGVCSSSVIVGSVSSLLDLCAGKRASSIIDILVEDETSAAKAEPVARFMPLAPLKVVHVTSVEEYARLQRGDYGRRAAQVDVRA